MLIRSQQKVAFVNLNHIDTLSTTEKKGMYEIKAYNGNSESESSLGVYSTEEKAIKVLDMIQEEFLKYLYGQGGLMATSNHYVPPFAFVPPKVFQMPQDSEVIID